MFSVFLSLIFVTTFIFLIKKKFYRPKGNFNVDEDLQGKVFIITGANSGIGYATALKLAKMNATVVFACRNEQQAVNAISQVEKHTNNQNLLFIQLDLANLNSLSKFTSEFREKGLKLHGLINNAGIWGEGNEKTETFPVNHLGHFSLTLQLLDNLNETNGRVVIVSSSLHSHASNKDLEDIPLTQKGPARLIYAASKLANVHFGFELQRRLEEKGSKVKSYVVHPGIVATQLARGRGVGALFIFKNLIVPLFGTTADRAAESIVYCAVSPEVESKGGRYFGYCIEDTPSPETNDFKFAKSFWALSENLTRTKFE